MACSSEEALDLKEKGNNCMKDGSHEEAVLHYSHAIKLDDKNYSLYSNRSLAFLKMRQYYLALEDAKETIKLKPEWAKGYFRKGEVEYQTFNFNDALLSYTIAATLQPNDPSIMSALDKTKKGILKDKRDDKQIPWVGAGVGIIVAVIIVISDHLFNFTLYSWQPLSMTFSAILLSLCGYIIFYLYRNYTKAQRSALLDPPPDLFGQKETDVPEEKERETKPRYTKAQARHRFKKGRT